MEINSIVIVGGGSAAWMSASMLIKAFPNKKISVIESPDIPRVGVGESTYDGIQKFVKFLDIDQEDFFAHTNASIKLAIKFSNFYDNTGDNDFVYPFGPPNLDGTFWGLDDWQIKRFCGLTKSNTEYAESYFPAASLIKHNTFAENFDSFISERDTALHFDALRFADWLRDRYSLPRGVSLIKANVIDTKISERGIESLTLDNGEAVSADLFVDCTGFKGLLINKTLNTKFISYSDVLPNNRAWATQLDYVLKEKELTGLTTCTAIENGWVWDIPLWSRLGAGYVYSDKFVDPEQALEEFKKYLNKTKKRSNKQISDLKFNDISMRVGINEKIWNKNVVAIGLSAGFIEPLESNGLFTVHEFLFQLITALSRKRTTQWDVDVFNHETRRLYDDFVNFIRMHYSLSIRNDTPYWKHNYERSNSFKDGHLLDLKQARVSGTRAESLGPMTWIATGMNYYIPDDVSLMRGQFINRMDYALDLQSAFSHLDSRRSLWNNRAKREKSFIEFLYEKYYKAL